WKKINIPGRGEYILIYGHWSRPITIPLCPLGPRYYLIPTSLPSDSYVISSIANRILINNISCWNDSFCFIYPPNFALHDSFLVAWGCDRDIYQYLRIIPLYTHRDTIDACRNCYYTAVNKRTDGSYEGIYSIGDFDGDGCKEILLTKNSSVLLTAPNFPITAGPCDTLDAKPKPNTVSYLIRGRPSWRGFWDTLFTDRATSRLNVFYHDSSEAFAVSTDDSVDLNSDGLVDIIISIPSFIINRGDFVDGDVDPTDTLLIERNDSSKIYIIYGRRGYRWNRCDSVKNIADVIIKSRLTDNGAGAIVSVGDYNGDGWQDILLVKASIHDKYIAYLILGNSMGEYPEYMEDADIKIAIMDTEYVYDYHHNLLFVFYPHAARLGDLNGDGLDDIVIICKPYNFRNISHFPFSFPFGYIFFNRRPTPALYDPKTNILKNPHDTVCFKILFKQPLALHTLLLTVSGDTFTIDSPQVVYNPAESLLCFIPDTEWDTSTIIPFCIEHLEDTIGTAMRGRWCVRFNDTTWNVNQPPKPRTLSLTCYPNPFNAEVRIKLRMPDVGDIKIDIYDISGKLIDYIHKSKLTAGWHELVWRPNINVPSGVYLLKVSAGGEAVVRRVVLVR
ncbi:MAG: hypothetical protein DRI22_05120, partial [Caldiserica bacterium]